MRKSRPGKNSWSRPLADFVQAAIDPVVARQGFGQSSLILFWDEIAGERLAAISQPVKMQWPPRGRAARADTEPGAGNPRHPGRKRLCARIAASRPPHHRAHQCPFRLALRLASCLEARSDRGAAPGPARGPRARQAAQTAAERLVGDVADEPLRQALTRLGARVLSEP